MAHAIAAVLSGAVVGFFVGMTGISSVLVLPTLILILKVEPVASLGTALFYALMTKIAAAVSHWRLGNVERRTAGWTILGVVPGIIAASWAVIELKRAYPEATQSSVRTAAGAVLVVSFVLMAWDSFLRRDTAGEAATGAGGRLRLALKGVSFGLVLGGIMGATSIGGGVFMLPVLMAWFSLTPRQAVGTGTVVSLAAVAFGSVVYQRGGEMNWAIAVTMFAGSLPGVYLGARVATRLPAKALRTCVLAVMVIAAVMLFFGKAASGH